VYIRVITDVSERCWSLTSEEVATEQTGNESDGFTDDFGDLGASFVQSSDGEHYARLVGRIFTKDCLVELLLMHLTENCHTPAPGSTEPAKLLPKLAKLVAQMLSKFAEKLVNWIPVDSPHRVKISEQLSERLISLLGDVEHNEFGCSSDVVSVLNSFVPLMSLSVLTRLIVVLLQSLEDCVETLEDGSRTLSDRGKLMVCVLQHIIGHLDVVQTELLTGVSVRLCKILKLVPSNDMVCSSLTMVSKRLPLFASNVTEDVVSSLLKAGSQPSLNLMMSLTEDNENCKRLMVEWFAARKTWTREHSLPLYVSTVLFILRTCEKGLLLTCFIFVTCVCLCVIIC